MVTHSPRAHVRCQSASGVLEANRLRKALVNDSQATASASASTDSSYSSDSGSESDTGTRRIILGRLCRDLSHVLYEAHRPPTPRPGQSGLEDHIMEQQWAKKAGSDHPLLAYEATYTPTTHQWRCVMAFGSDAQEAVRYQYQAEYDVKDPDEVCPSELPFTLPALVYLGPAVYEYVTPLHLWESFMRVNFRRRHDALAAILFCIFAEPAMAKLMLHPRE